jgi:hypothetical protein
MNQCRSKSLNQSPGTSAARVQTFCVGEFSREAAQERSPERKPWVAMK